MSSSEWGRVEPDGTVYVKTAEGERSVGQYAAGSTDDALAFFTKRFDALAAEVELLEKRVQGARVSPEEAGELVRSLRAQVVEANAVGDLAGLAGRLDALAPLLAQQREEKRAEKAERTAQAKADKEALIARAEKVAEGQDWRGGSQALRDLLDEWKALPRIDRPSDDELWKRYSAARSTFARRRKAHYAELDTKREGARVVKQRLVKDAEAISGSTDWGATAGKYRDLMRDWKAAGPAPRDVEDELWGRFRAAQDAFFGARDAANAALDAEFAGNAEVKEQILLEAEALVPVRDLEATKKAFRVLSERWEDAGKVPRGRIKELEGRMRKVEQAVRAVEDERWKRSDPEKSARADGMVAQLEQAIAVLEQDLEKARSAGSEKKVAEIEQNLASRRSFLEAAQRASADFG